MNLSRRQIALGGAAVVFVIAFCALAYLLYSANSARVDARAERDEATATYQHYYEARVFPCPVALAAVKSNETVLAAWHAAALAQAGRGVRPLPTDSATAFKQRLQSEARRLGALPGGVDGRIAAPSFLFGFDKYLGDNMGLPDQRDVPKLEAELDLISHVVGLFAEAHVLEVSSVKRDEAPVAPPPEAGRRPKPGVRAAAGPEAERLSYSFMFQVRPTAFVEVVNALTSDPRFIVITDLSFSQTADRIVEKLSARSAAAAKKEGSGSSARSTRSSRLEAMLEKNQNEEKKEESRLVIDPELDAPIQVSISLDVYAFPPAEPPAAGRPAKEGAPAANPPPPPAKPAIVDATVRIPDSPTEAKK